MIDFITDYHVKKACVDAAYYQKTAASSKLTYDTAKTKYARFDDANREVTLQKTRGQLSYLEGEMEIAKEAYFNQSKSLSDTEAKIQEAKPSFTTIQSATVPVTASGPLHAKFVFNKLLMTLIFITLYVFYKEDNYKEIIGIQ